jgi:hypothetical protein
LRRRILLPAKKLVIMKYKYNYNRNQKVKRAKQPHQRARPSRHR